MVVRNFGEPYFSGKIMNIEEILIGETKFQAKRISEYNNYELRVVSEDGVYFIVTADFRVDRVNVELSDGNVIKAYVG